MYAYPDTRVCLSDTYGCHSLDLEEECVNSSNLTEGGQSRAVFYPGGEFEQEVSAVAHFIESVRGACKPLTQTDH